MGSKEEDVPKEPVEKTLFVEDMNETELATAVSNFDNALIGLSYMCVLDIHLVFNFAITIIPIEIYVIINIFITLQLDLPAGLTNLGNTCYMNATVQCLKTVPELRDALQSYQGGMCVIMILLLHYLILFI